MPPPTIPNKSFSASVNREENSWPAEEREISLWTDKYFVLSKETINKFGDARVTYAIFMRRPVISAPRLGIKWLTDMAYRRNTKFDVDLRYPEGEWVGAGEPIMYISGQFSQLVDLETLLLQRIGPACVAAYNAFTMCSELPNVSFLAMDARHCAGSEMAEMMAYAASVGSQKAKDTSGATGFIGNATDATAHYFDQKSGLGTMPHAFVGYAGSTLRAAQMFDEAFPNKPMTVLVDYFAHEITDSLSVAAHFPKRVEDGSLAVRMDTPGSRYVEKLDPTVSYAVLEKHVPDVVRGYRLENELSFLVGPGVSSAAIWHLRDALNEKGYQNVKIIGSSGFSPAKCRIFGTANTPVDIIGTGSYLPENWPETYATADIVEYNGEPRVKVGREFLLRK
tara:strand:- start:850 stop:2031 length:1182 start_codon:yes stop_codon:yes gene_type:complete